MYRTVQTNDRNNRCFVFLTFDFYFLFREVSLHATLVPATCRQTFALSFVPFWKRSRVCRIIKKGGGRKGRENGKETFCIRKSAGRNSLAFFERELDVSRLTCPFLRANGQEVSRIMRRDVGEEKNGQSRRASEISRRKLEIDSAPPFFFSPPWTDETIERERESGRMFARVDSFSPSLGKERKRNEVWIATQLFQKWRVCFAKRRTLDAESRERNNRFDSMTPKRS